MAKKFELSINVDYLRNWGVWEGVRELVQNGMDAQTEHNAPLSIDWRKNSTLRINNEGCVLKREALLLGTTSKADRDDMIGSFGEGLKLGILALVRAGRPVKIRTGSEVWMPTIARSERFEADVLMFTVTDGHKDEKRVRVEIGGVTEPEWKEYRTRFLFMKDGRESDKHIVKTGAGDLLLHSRHIGKLYVKGIFVCDQPGLAYGYNFRDAAVDRDRKMIGEFDRERGQAAILHMAVATRPDLMTSYIDLVNDIDNPDTKGVNEFRLPSEDVQVAAANWFTQKYGDNAVPVTTLADSADVEHFGMKGVMVSAAMACVLKPKLGSAKTVKEKFAKATTKMYAIGDLTKAECRALKRAVRTVRKANKLKNVLSRLDVVDFCDADLRGLHRGERISIARKVLADDVSGKDNGGTLRTLVHELAHDAGADGDKGHVATIERYWQRITVYLMERQK